MNNLFESVMERKSDEELLKVVASNEGEYRTEALEAAKKEMKKRGLNMKKVAEIREKNKLNENKGLTISVKCANCKFKGTPVKWGARTCLGIFYLFVALIPGIIFFESTNPFICPKCGKRDALSKVFENKVEEKIESKSKEDFLNIAIPITAVLIFLLLYRLS